MNILIGCEFSGVVREAFRNKGHNAWSCDLEPSDIEGNHFQEDIFEVINKYKWDMMIAFPPCTYLTVTGNKWMKPEFKNRFPDRLKQREDAIEFFLKLWNADIEKIAIENPVGVMSSILRKPDQIIHPYYFGEPHAKRTCLWLKNLPKLTPTNIVEPEYYTYANGKRDPIWHIKTTHLPKEERTKIRSKTFQSIADEMSNQWG